MTKYRINANPCETCPYRKDTPPGIWHESEYRKLAKWDDPMRMNGVFLCHNGGAERDTVCRGWLEVHHENLSVCLVERLIEWTERTLRPTTIALYRTGREAMIAGLKGVARPSRAAKEKIQKLAKQKGKFRF